MEPHREAQSKAPPSAERKPQRFRILKLEDRIAPAKGGQVTHQCTGYCPSPTFNVTCVCSY